MSSAAGVARVTERLDARSQLVLSAYWSSLSFHGGALLPVAVASQLIDIAPRGPNTAELALMGGLSGLVVTVIQPIAGVCSDLTHGPFGRRRPYVLLGALVDIVGLLVLAGAHSVSLVLIGLLVATAGSGTSGAAYQAYIPDRVPADQYGEASGYMGAMMMAGTIASFGLAGILVQPDQSAPFYLITAAVVAAGALVTVLGIPDPVQSEGEVPVIGGWRALWIEPWKNRDFSWVFATRAMLMLALYTLFTFVAYYVRDVVHVTSFAAGAAAVAGVATIAALAGGIATGILSDRWGRKPLVSVASMMMSLSLLVLAFFHQFSLVLGVGVVFGLALGTYTAVDWALAVAVLPSERLAAKDLGLWGISTNLPQMVAPFLGGAVLATLAPFGVAFGYGVLFLGAAAAAASSGVLVWRVRGVR